MSLVVNVDTANPARVLRQLCARARFHVAMFPLLLLLAVLTRLPFLNNLGSDEVFYLIVGRQWLEGNPPYAGAFDVKPPLLFALFAGAEAIFGPTLIAAKILTMLAVFAASSGIYVMGRRYVGKVAGVGAALLYVIASIALEGTFSPAELIMAPFIIFGMLTALSALFEKPKHAARLIILSGLLFGAACSIKHTAVFEAMALIGFLFYRKPLQQAFRLALLFAAGASVIPALFAVYFLWLGHFQEFFFDVVIAAFGRASANFVPWSEAAMRFSIEIFFIFPLVLAAGAAWLVKPGIQTRKTAFLRLFFTSWAAGALLGIVVTRAMLFFYALTLLPPFCLLAGLFLEHGFQNIRLPRRRFIARVAVFVLVCYYIILTVAMVALPSGDNYEAGRQAAALMKEHGLTASDHILVADRDSVVYLTSGARAPSRIFNQMHLLCEFPVPGAATALDDAVRSKPMFIIESDPPSPLGCEMPNRRSVLNAALKAEYCPLGRFGSAWTGGHPAAFIVYGLKNKISGHC